MGRRTAQERVFSLPELLSAIHQHLALQELLLSPLLVNHAWRAGGIGFIGADNDMKRLDEQLRFLVFLAKLDEAVAVMSRQQPAVIWLSCPSQIDDLETWTKAMRKASPSSQIWIQVASVSIALSVASSSSPDIRIMQGAYAGEHGPCPGAGIVSLVPETRDALDKAGFSDIGILATGGISDGRGVAAALASGADGVMMGTRFLASEEIEMPIENFRNAILETRDGGVGTARSTLFDELRGESVWPSQYDGRIIAGASHKDMRSGIDITELRTRYPLAAKESHKGFGGEVRGAIWAGTEVGLVTEVKTAGEIVEEVRDAAKLCLEKAIKGKY